MPIDNVSNGGNVKPVPFPARTPSAAPVQAGQRQVLPGSGQSSPPAAGAGLKPGGDIKQAVQELNHYAQSLSRELRFSIDETSGETVIKVMDHESGEVIRQIPSEELLAIAHNLESAQGLLLSTKA
jgi:flagellar protein FlaG